jgi:hypothetical protein
MTIRRGWRLATILAIAIALGSAFVAVGAATRTTEPERIVPAVVSSDLPICMMGSCWW